LEKLKLPVLGAEKEVPPPSVGCVGVRLDPPPNRLPPVEAPIAGAEPVDAPNAGVEDCPKSPPLLAPGAGVDWLAPPNVLPNEVPPNKDEPELCGVEPKPVEAGFPNTFLLAFMFVLPNALPVEAPPPKILPPVDDPPKIEDVCCALPNADCDAGDCPPQSPPVLCCGFPNRPPPCCVEGDEKRPPPPAEASPGPLLLPIA